MRLLAVVAAIAAALAVAAQALAGTATQSATSITYMASPATNANETVDIGVNGPVVTIYSDREATASTNCTQVDAQNVTCPLAPALVVTMLGFDDRVDATNVTTATTLEAHGGGGSDDLRGTPNADRLFGEDGGDTLDGRAGNDTLDGGPGENYFHDGPGDDSVIGGVGNDTFHAGPGRDTFTGGASADTIDYGARTAAVTITLNDAADDGEAGEGDNAASDIENAFGGAGNDVIAAGAGSVELRGGPGNDRLTGSPAEDRVEGNEGDDVIDTRDGRYDSVDCGPGNDTLLGDPADSATGCEIAPDRDGDGHLNEADCRPDDPAINPAAPEIYGNDVDEDCKGGPAYFRVDAQVAWTIIRRKAPARVRFAVLRVSALKAGDRVVVSCKGKGCPPVKRKQYTGRSGRPLTILAFLKKRFLRVGAVVEIRIQRANYIGKVVRLQVARGPVVRQRTLCLLVGKTVPQVCPPSP